MIASARAFLARLIDYAGLFPPARLEMAAAAAEYARLRREPAAWMLARFVCPASRLAELATCWQAGDLVPPIAVVALGSGAATAAELTERTRDDAVAIHAFHLALARRAIVDQFEVRLPADSVAARDPAAVGEAIADLEEALAPVVERALLLAVEFPLAGGARAELDAAVRGIAGANTRRPATGVPPVCLKLRCGGVTAASVPATAELAAAIAACRDHGVPIKATQGLHHPFRRPDPQLGVAVHGFVNLITAAVLARARGLDEAAIAAILEDGDPAHFVFDAHGLAWNGVRASGEEIAAGRRLALVSFGSCSFAEPRDDLIAARLLDPLG